MVSIRSKSIAGALLAICLVAPVQAATHRGDALGASLDAPLLPAIELVDTGDLPAGGGALSNFLLNVNANLLSQTLVSGTMNVSTMGGGGSVTSVAQTEGLRVGLDVFPLQAVITAAVVRATSTASCGASSGSTVIVDLRINDVAVVVTGQPNQVISIPGVATVTLNEQILVQTGETTDLTVNAIHIRVLGSLVDIIISQAHAGMTDCGPLGVTTAPWGGVKSLYR